MPVIVENLKTIVRSQYEGAHFVYIGREGYGHKASPLANSFHVGADGTREEVIDKYRMWLQEQMESKTPARREIVRLGRMHFHEMRDVVLLCYCKPLACHGDVVREFILGECPVSMSTAS